jgi:hypothetical protein
MGLNQLDDVEQPPSHIFLAESKLRLKLGGEFGGSFTSSIHIPASRQECHFC